MSANGQNHALESVIAADERRLGRRTALATTGWSACVVLATAPAATAAVSTCTVTGSIQPGPLVDNTMRAICTAQSQYLSPGTLNANYGIANLPSYLEICNCQNADSWYRWRETDTLEEFQIEVDGVHVDQNGSASGWRNAFFLPGFGGAGGCKRFALSYRTSVPRSRTNPEDVSVTFTLESGPSASGPWTTVPGTPITVNGTVRRTLSPDTVNFNSCSAGGTARVARSAGANAD